jgi:hypothetical protein
MKALETRYKSNFKRTIIKCVALLFVIYVFADITVLQAYCGNEAIGIPPAHHLSAQNNESQKVDNNVSINNQNYSQPSNQESEQDCNDDCCFCCSSHITLGYFAFEPRVTVFAKNNSLHSSFHENKHSYSALNSLFRPPRIA